MLIELWQKFRRLDGWLVTALLALCVASVIAIDAATFASDEFRDIYWQQLYWIPIGLAIFFTLALVDYQKWFSGAPSWAQIGAGVIGLLLVLVLIPGVGTLANGARSWLRFAGVGIQPGELCKLAFILLLADWLARRDKKIKSFGTFVRVCIFCLVPIGLILPQPDLGSAAVFFPIAFVMMFIAGVRKRYLAVPVIAGVAVFFVAYYGIYQNNWHAGLKPYQVNRIKTFFNPNLDPQNAGWTINQSLIAIGSGGWNGKGWRQGTQNVLGFLPRNIAYNDFIFSVIGEEHGFVGGTLVIVLLGVTLLSCLRAAFYARQDVGVLVCAGVAALFFTHIFVNIGMTMQVVPITGIPLPFISYGGTFFVVCMAAMGLVQSVWVHRRL